MYITWPSTVIAFCFYVSLMVLIVLLSLTVIYKVDTSLLIPRYGRVINCQIQLWTPFVENERCEPLPTALPVFIHWTWCKAASTLLSFGEASGATVLGRATQRWHRLPRRHEHTWPRAGFTSTAAPTAGCRPVPGVGPGSARIPSPEGPIWP